MPKKRYRAIFISPHLDDAVFSCAGQIIEQKKQGDVFVLNIFTNFLEGKKNRGIVLGKERYFEEEKASQFLGYDFQNLNEVDAALRRRDYESIGNIFRWPVNDDWAYLPSLRQKVFSILDGLDYDFLFIPLAVGWHVDHRLTFEIFRPWFQRSGLRFYEDAPYSYIANATDYRLCEMGLPPIDLSAPKIKSIWETIRSFCSTGMIQNLSPAIIRWGAGPVVSLYLWRLITSYLKSSRHERPMTHETFYLGADLEQRKLEAMKLYQSQFKEFFTGRENSYGPSERFWRITHNASK